MRDTMRRRSLLAIALSAGLMLLGVQPAAAATHFGANLSGLPFPSNAYPGTYCDHIVDGGSSTYTCTWIMDNAYQTGGSGIPGSKAPMDGHIGKVKLIAGHGGSFRLFLARYNNNTQKGKIVRKGPVINYATDACSPDCHIQTFNIAPLTVHTGDRIAIRTNKTSTLRCDQGSDHISVYDPPLPVGGGLTTATETDGCYLLIQLVYN